MTCKEVLLISLLRDMGKNMIGRNKRRGLLRDGSMAGGGRQ